MTEITKRLFDLWMWLTLHLWPRRFATWYSEELERVLGELKRQGKEPVLRLKEYD